jgi:sulfide:quinone oxidoreductase
VRSFAHGELAVAPSGHRVLAERVIAAPRLRGPAFRHLPSDAAGFLPTDPDGRVPGTEGVYAAGDCTAFPVKHPSLAAQQADAVAAAITGEAEPFTPVLRCMLPSRLCWWVEAPLTGGQGDATRISAHPLWSGDARFAARHLTPALAEMQEAESGDGSEHRCDDDHVDAGHYAPAAAGAH